MSDQPSVHAAAFAELRLVIERHGALDLAIFPGEAADAFSSTDPDALFSDELFVDVLVAADDAIAAGSGTLVREVGAARADAKVDLEAFKDQPLTFLKEGATSFYEGRSNYGAASTEISPNRAVVRLVAPEHYARRGSDAPNRAPLLFQGFLERAIELLSGVAQPARYAGFAPRIDARFERPMVNLLFEFDLEP